MKRADAPKPIDPAVLKKILGGAQPVEDKNQKAAVIEQSSFYSFYHS
ncbi:MAG TPA: hypothetical protein VF789_20955 [Thermoanaerobaculia bacterium]